MQQRYLKKNSNQTLMFSGAIETTSETNLEEMALNQGGVLSDYTIGIEEDDVIQGWWKAQDEARKTYSDKRKEEYDKLNQYEMMAEDLINGTTLYVDAIKAIKDKYPKE